MSYSTQTEANYLNINFLWFSNNEKDWKNALNYYDYFLDSQQRDIENRMNNIDSSEVKKFSAREFYNFLYNEYFVWKYTAKNRLATTRKSLSKYEQNNSFNELQFIQENLFTLYHKNIEKCLKTASNIHGLGIAGASGLLSILFPTDFGTVDQFVVKALCKIEALEEHSLLLNINPDNLKPKDGVLLINIMRNKANELNQTFNTTFWTPRKIDMILWCIGR